ncbi:hypothetical protein RRG08_046529 [Elysia crispata]|uniref:Secreted protein n=1 Tax=Elysia crispata TaxID=231223 RepID=A0AAE0Z839_9GAST|nr:hypothetical protein RRG08_046529 [Elysia crispata]
MRACYRQFCIFFAFAHTFVFLACVATHISNGGSISVHFLNKTEQGWMVQVESRLGWTLRNGPCPDPCSADTSVGTRSRVGSPRRPGNHFGRCETDPKNQQPTRESHITSNVNGNIVAFITEVDELLEYIVESSIFILQLGHTNSSYTLR